MFGAGDEARTRDIQLGRLKLYQLSYSRLFYQWLSVRALRRQRFFKLQSMHSGRSHVVLCDPDSEPKSPTYNSPVDWWWGEDLNLRRLRRQIYSLFPLTTREPHQIIDNSLARCCNVKATRGNISIRFLPKSYEPRPRLSQLAEITPPWEIRLNGASGGTRTPDPLITNQ